MINSFYEAEVIDGRKFDDLLNFDGLLETFFMYQMKSWATVLGFSSVM